MLIRNGIRTYKPVPDARFSRMHTKPGMKDGMYFVFSILIIVGLAGHIEFTSYKSVSAKSIQKTVAQPVIASDTKANIRVDERVEKLMNFLILKKSPFAYLAGYMVELSDQNGIDYTLMASISGMESGYGINTRQECHNPFGLGGSNLMCFDSWEDAIEYEARLLNEHYRVNIAKGIQTKYCPDVECNPNWADTVSSTAHEILTMKGGE